MSANLKKVAKSKQKKSQARAARNKAKSASNRKAKVASLQQKNNRKSAERVMFMNAIERKDPRLFKFLHEGMTDGNFDKTKLKSKEEMKKDIADIVGSSAFIANRIQLMSAIGLAKFGITQEEHVEFEDALVNIFENVETLLDKVTNIQVEDMDMLSDVTSSMMIIYEMIERVGNKEFLTKYAEELKQVDEYGKGLVKAWVERGHSEKDISNVLFERYLAYLFARKEQAMEAEKAKENSETEIQTETAAAE